MKSKDWLLLFIKEKPDNEQAMVDPIRIMKGMFYFVKKSHKSSIYKFEPYHLGPVSFSIYDDLDTLIEEGYVTAEDVSGGTWKNYIVTEAGSSKAEELKSKANTKLLETLRKEKNLVCSLGFIDLLKNVYKEYPKYATHSVFHF